MSTTLNLSQMRQTIKANARKLNAIDPTLNLKAGDVSQMDAKALVPLIELLNAAPAEETVQSNAAVAVESDSFITANDGTQVPVVIGTLIEQKRDRKKNRYFLFQAAGRIVHCNSRMLKAIAIGMEEAGKEMPVGYQVALDPKSFSESRLANGEVFVWANIIEKGVEDASRVRDFVENNVSREDEIMKLAMRLGLNPFDSKDLAEAEVIYDAELIKQSAAEIKPARKFAL